MRNKKLVHTQTTSILCMYIFHPWAPSTLSTIHSWAPSTLSTIHPVHRPPWAPSTLVHHLPLCTIHPVHHPPRIIIYIPVLFSFYNKTHLIIGVTQTSSLSRYLSFIIWWYVSGSLHLFHRHVRFRYVDITQGTSVVSITLTYKWSTMKFKMVYSGKELQQKDINNIR